MWTAFGTVLDLLPPHPVRCVRSRRPGAPLQAHRREMLAGVAVLGAASLLGGPAGSPALAADPDSIYGFSGTLDGVEFPLSQFHGKVVAICNVASL